MVTVVRYSRIFLKLIIALIVLFVIFTYQNSYVKRRRIRHFQIWKHVFRRRMANVNYILIWSKDDIQLNVIKKDYEAFTKNNCIYNNCFVTKDRHMFDNDYRNFDAIIISAKGIYKNDSDVPKERYANQTYIFASTESADYYPVCDSKFDNYFNLTWTYKLSSDIPWPYFSVFDVNGLKIAPKKTVKWVYDMKAVPNRVMHRISRMKTLGVAWFASNCYTNSKREHFVLLLKIALKKLGVEIDAVGECGTRQCPIEKESDCMDILKQYFFYLAFENSFSEDYVSEKVLKPLLHYTVPIVYGGANYSRFLPPHSFINAYELGAEKTAALMAQLIVNHTAYVEYFRWHNHYVIKPKTNSICSLCKELNRRKVREFTELREWWEPKYKSKCKSKSKRSVKNKNKRYLSGTTCSMDDKPYLMSFLNNEIEKKM